MGDNWVTDGNCNECGKRKYCSKPCKAISQVQKVAHLNLSEESGAEQFAELLGIVKDSPGNPIDVGKIGVYRLGVLQDLLKAVLNAETLDAITTYGNSALFLHDNYVYVIHPTYEKCLCKRVFKHLKTETKVLSILEKYGNYVFEERKFFTPLTLLQRFFGKRFESYGDAANFLFTTDYKRDMDMMRILSEHLAPSPLVLDNYAFLYSLAGYYYYRRHQIAFRGDDSETIKASTALHS